MKKTDNPCFNCQDRTHTCHDTCERYKAWKQMDLAAKKRKTAAMRQLSDEAFRVSQSVRYCHKRKCRN